MNAKLIAIHAPPAPKCFESRSLWVEYLTSAFKAAAGSNAVRPFVDEKYNPKFRFCNDCPAQHAHAMTVAKRCDYKSYVISITPVATPNPEVTE